MACLGAVAYDPAGVVSASIAALLPLTAFDTTNARVTFTAPTNGAVMVRMKVQGKGGTSVPPPLFGVLDGATIRGRSTPALRRTTSAATLAVMESSALVTGLTPGNSYTWDAAYGVETIFAATSLVYGGPNNATASDAGGPLVFEVWDTLALLAGVHYDPAVAVTKNTTAALAMTALDTTNLRLGFTVPASGRVAVQMYGTWHGSINIPNILLGVLEGSTVRQRQEAISNLQAAATDLVRVETFGVVGGLTPAASLTWDAAYGVEVLQAGSGIKYGGPDNVVTNDAFGGFGFLIWAA